MTKEQYEEQVMTPMPPEPEQALVHACAEVVRLRGLLGNLAAEVRKEEAFQRRQGRVLLHEDSFIDAVLYAEVEQ